MSCDFLSLANPGVQGLIPYQPGKPMAELQRELGQAHIVKLASNENPLGPSPRVKAAIEQALDELTRYPDGNGFTLKQKLCSKHPIELAQITLGNGSNDILELVGRAYLNKPSDEVVFSEHSFAVYPLVTQACGAVAKVAKAKSWGHDLDAILAQITSNTKIVFIANPNNPTGTWVARTQLGQFLAQVPEDVLVVLDEAYTEYVDELEFPNGLDFLKEHPNLLVTRTFSKAYGLAGLRVGYSVSSAVIADVLNRVRQPFNVNSLALAAAEAALDDSDYLARSVALNSAGLAQLTSGFGHLKLSYIPSVANFIAVEVGEHADKIYQQLLQQGVIVRPVANYQMPNFLRVSVGTEQENQTFLDMLATLVGA